MHETGLTVHMAVLERDEAVIIEKVEAPNWLGWRHGSDVGLMSTAQGLEKYSLPSCHMINLSISSAPKSLPDIMGTRLSQRTV
jgi:hypothetical protein